MGDKDASPSIDVNNKLLIEALTATITDSITSKMERLMEDKFEGFKAELASSSSDRSTRRRKNKTPQHIGTSSHPNITGLGARRDPMAASYYHTDFEVSDQSQRSRRRNREER
jgi:hypothetical protein